MQPITVKSKLDLKTYYKIGLANIYKRVPVIIVFALYVFTISLYIYDGSYEWDSSALFLAWGALFFILLPVLTWFRCKRYMKISPVLAEGAIYTISDEFIENVSPSCTAKSTWKNINKAVENDNYFVLYTDMRSMHFLPKGGFASNGDIDQFKQMIKMNNVKAYLK